MSRSYEKYDLKSIRMITYGTEAMPESLLLRLKELFPKARLLQTFGTSETGIARTSSKSSNSTKQQMNYPSFPRKIFLILPKHRIWNSRWWNSQKGHLMFCLFFVN